MSCFENNSPEQYMGFCHFKRRRRPKHKVSNIQSCDVLKPVTSFDDQICMRTARVGSLVEELRPKTKNSLLIQITKINTTSSFGYQNFTPTCPNSNYLSQSTGIYEQLQKEMPANGRRQSLKLGLKKYTDSCLSERLCMKAKAYPTNILEPCNISKITPGKRPITSYRCKIAELTPSSRNSFRSSKSVKNCLELLPQPQKTVNRTRKLIERKRAKQQIKNNARKISELEVQPWKYQDQDFELF